MKDIQKSAKRKYTGYAKRSPALGKDTKLVQNTAGR